MNKWSLSGFWDKTVSQNKPIKWGIKVYMLCGESGLIYDFLIYQGQSTPVSKDMMDKFGHGPTTVLHLAERLERNANHKLFFDNYFTSVALVEELNKLGVFCAGTI